MKPILILGIEMRSGTNYVFDLISKHPDCEPASEIMEDQLLLELAYLDKYLSTLDFFWGKFKPVRTTKEEIYRQTENYLHNLLMIQAVDKDKKLFVTKTPSFFGIENAPKLLPNTKLILFIRDGRSVVYSLEKSFGIEYFSALRRWKAAARRLRAFVQKNPEYYQDNCFLIRYEDVFSAPEENLRKVFNFLELDADRYEYELADQSPVIGSSDLREKHSKINWEKQERSRDFSPLKRYEKWPAWKLDYATFYLAEELAHFHYDADRKPAAAVGLVHLSHQVRIAAEKLSVKSLKRRIKTELLDSER